MDNKFEKSKISGKKNLGYHSKTTYSKQSSIRSLKSNNKDQIRQKNDQKNNNYYTNIYKEEQSFHESVNKDFSKDDSKKIKSNKSDFFENDSNFEGINNGVRILVKNSKLKENTIYKDKLLQDQFDAEIHKNCTFKPKLNKNSIKIVQEKSFSSSRNEGSREFNLYEQAFEKAEKLNIKIRQYEEEKYLECSFRPSVNLMYLIFLKI